MILLDEGSPEEGQLETIFSRRGRVIRTFATWKGIFRVQVSRDVVYNDQQDWVAAKVYAGEVLDHHAGGKHFPLVPPPAPCLIKAEVATPVRSQE